MLTIDTLFPPITNYYKTSNSWKCSRFKAIVGRGRAKLSGITGHGRNRGRI